MRNPNSNPLLKGNTGYSWGIQLYIWWLIFAYFAPPCPPILSTLKCSQKILYSTPCPQIEAISPATHICITSATSCSNSPTDLPGFRWCYFALLPSQKYFPNLWHQSLSLHFNTPLPPVSYLELAFQSFLLPSATPYYKFNWFSVTSPFIWLKYTKQSQELDKSLIWISYTM